MPPRHGRASPRRWRPSGCRRGARTASRGTHAKRGGAGVSGASAGCTQAASRSDPRPAACRSRSPTDADHRPDAVRIPMDVRTLKRTCGWYSYPSGAGLTKAMGARPRGVARAATCYCTVVSYKHAFQRQRLPNRVGTSEWDHAHQRTPITVRMPSGYRWTCGL